MLNRRTMLGSLAAAAVVGGLGVRPVRADTEPLVYIGKDGWLFPGWEHETGIPPALADAGLRMMVQAHDALAKNGIKCYISMVPSKGRVYPEFLPASVVPTAEFMNRYHHALSYFSAAGVPAPNCLDPMLAAKSQNLQYMKTDSHWTGYGSIVSATATAQMMGIPNPEPDPLPAGVPIPGKTYTLDVKGDLVPLLPPDKQAGYKPDPVLVQDWTPSGGSPATTFPAACVGTSAAKENLSFSQTIANKIAQPMDLYWKYGSVGPWRTLVQYFEIQKKAGKPLPKTLVWQINDYIFAAGPDAVGAWGKDNIYPTDAAWLAALTAATKP